MADGNSRAWPCFPVKPQHRSERAAGFAPTKRVSGSDLAWIPRPTSMTGFSLCDARTKAEVQPAGGPSGGVAPQVAPRYSLGCGATPPDGRSSPLPVATATATALADHRALLFHQFAARWGAGRGIRANQASIGERLGADPAARPRNRSLRFRHGTKAESSRRWTIERGDGPTIRLRRRRASGPRARRGRHAAAARRRPRPRP